LQIERKLERGCRQGRSSLPRGATAGSPMSRGSRRCEQPLHRLRMKTSGSTNSVVYRNWHYARELGRYDYSGQARFLVVIPDGSRGTRPGKPMNTGLWPNLYRVVCMGSEFGGRVPAPRMHHFA